MGTLEVKLCDGTLLKDVAWLGKQSPYCVLTIGAQTFRSVTHTHGGSTPVWNTFFHFKDVTADHVLHIQCYHEAMLPQHPLLEALALLGLKRGPERWLLGQCCVPLNEVPIHGSQEVRVLLFSRKGKGRGALRILLEFVLPAQAQQRDPEAAPVSGTQAHARRTPEERQGSSSGDMVPLPPALQLGRRLLDAVSQWPDQCLRLRHLELVRACLGHLQRSLVSTRWIQPSEVEILQQQPAEGGFAVVVQGAWEGRQVALKQFRPFHPASTIGRTLVQSFVREVCLLSQLRTAEQHDNIVGLLGFTADLEAGWLGIVLEWVGEGPAAALTVDRAAETATPQARLQYALDVVEGVRYLHSHTPCIVHRDLTSLNVLITPEGRAKLIDFGISQWLLRQGGTLSRNAALNPPWMPPEVLSGAERIKGLQVLSDCDEKCDVYSVGVILGQLATRTRPWAGMEENEVVQAFSGGARLGPPEVAQEWLGELISRCISEIPAARPDMEYVLHVLQSHQAEGILRSDAPWPVIWPECSGPS